MKKKMYQSYFNLLSKPKSAESGRAKHMELMSGIFLTIKGKFPCKSSTINFKILFEVRRYKEF